MSKRHVLAELILIAAAGLTTSGCGVTIGWMPTNAPPRPLRARPASEVQMFTAGRPSRPYVEVGLITAGIGKLGPDELGQLAALREEAGKQGCEGLIITGEDKLATADQYGAAERTSGFRSVCIMFTDVAPP